jgi:hypothetical protein
VGSIDSTTWQALGLLLTLLGLMVSFVVWRRRGTVAGLRAVAWSLLPAAAGLTGTLKLVWQIGDNIVSWAVHLVFSPIVWLGIVTAGVSLMLFAITAAMRARGLGGAGRGHGKDGGKDGGDKELPSERSSKPARSSGKSAAPADDDMADIEAILRKHGIS